jgi:hypothetical protein
MKSASRLVTILAIFGLLVHPMLALSSCAGSANSTSCERGCTMMAEAAWTNLGGHHCEGLILTAASRPECRSTTQSPAQSRDSKSGHLSLVDAFQNGVMLPSGGSQGTRSLIFSPRIFRPDLQVLLQVFRI